MSTRPECTQCACGSRDGVTRRDFIASSTLAAVAAMLAACGDGQIGMSSPTGLALPGGAGALTVNVADFPALANVGGMARVDGGIGAPVALVRTGTSSFAAFSLVCPHQGSTVNISGAGFRCPNHGATFDASGTWTGGQRASNMTSFPTTFDAAAGTVTITGGVGPGSQPPKGGDDDEPDDP